MPSEGRTLIQRPALSAQTSTRPNTPNALAPLLQAPKTVAGFAHLYSFPFWLHVNRASPLQTGLSVFPNRIGLRFYPPFRSAPANFSGLPGNFRQGYSFR